MGWMPVRHSSTAGVRYIFALTQTHSTLAARRHRGRYLSLYSRVSGFLNQGLRPQLLSVLSKCSARLNESGV
ncbi:hypothetical protein OH77DRAFT_1422195 [Trametes cingulata]|nr:hypothetical protein OH77DRAFT_1422195 [Trametes cingulata]